MHVFRACTRRRFCSFGSTPTAYGNAWYVSSMTLLDYGCMPCSVYGTALVPPFSPISALADLSCRATIFISTLLCSCVCAPSPPYSPYARAHSEVAVYSKIQHYVHTYTHNLVHIQCIHTWDTIVYVYTQL